MKNASDIPRAKICALLVLSSLAGALPLSAAGNMEVQLNSNRTTANTTGQIIDLRLSYGYSSATEAGEKVKLDLDLRPQLKLVSITGSSHTVKEELKGNKVEFEFIDPLPAGSTGQLRVQVRFKAGTADGDSVTLAAKMTALNAPDAESASVTVTASVPEPWTPPSFAPGAFVQKTGPSDLLLPYQAGRYFISHGNTGGAGQDIANYVVQDMLPAGTMLRSVSTGRFRGTALPVNVKYVTNLNATWSAWPGDVPTSNTGSHRYCWVGSLSLAANEWVIGVRVEYGTLPGGGMFHPDRPGNEPVRIGLRAAPGNGFSAGDVIQNCATVTGAGGVNASSCADTTIEAPRADLAFWDWDATEAGPYQEGDTVRIGMEVGPRGSNGVPVTDLNFSWLAPAEMDYAGNVQISGNGWDVLGQPAPVIEQIPNFGLSGRTLIRFSWPGSRLEPSGDWDTIITHFDVTVNSSAVLGTTVEAEVYGGWQTPQGTGFGWMVNDTLDYDRDGDQIELVAKDTSSYTFDVPPPHPGGGVASLSSVMWVKGSLDANWSRYPDTALTTPAGQADYELRITNDGGVALTGLTIIDILPHIGDAGVVTTGGRGSQWEPFLAGAVAVPSGVTVYYSTERNPQRDELTPGTPASASPANWSTELPADITAVKSLKFEFGNTWVLPGQEVVISWPMRVPSNAPSNGEVAWNSFGYIATRADDGVTLIPAEPAMTGIEVQPAGGAHYGDLVWGDADRDGMVGGGEEGINGVRVVLYKDDGDGVADPDADPQETFTVTSFDGVTDGSYKFTNLEPGDYFSVIDVPDGLSASLLDTSVGRLPSPVTNTGFEEVSNGDKPNGWYAVGATAHTHDDSTHEGVQRLHVKDRTVSLQGATQLITDRVQNDTTYQVEVYAFMEVMPDQLVLTMFNGLSPMDTFTSQILPVRSGSEQPWMKVTGTLTTRWNIDPAFATFHISTLGTKAPFYIDGLKVTPITGQDTRGRRDVAAGQNVAVMPVTSLAHEEHQLYWDQGMFDRSDGMAAVWALAEQGDGRIVIGGDFNGSHGVARSNIARVLENGQVDLSFDPGAGTDGVVAALTTLGDGSIIAGGKFGSYDGVSVKGLVALSEDGGIGVWIAQPNTADVRWLETDGDGKIMVGGGFTKIGGKERPCIARLAADGSVDTGFNPVGVNGHINGGAVLDDGRIAIAGDFTKVGGSSRPGVAVLHPDGSLDQTFSPKGTVDGPVRTIAVKSGRKLVLSGDFTSFGGKPVNGTVRVDLTGAVDMEMENSTLAVDSVRQSH